MTKKKLSQTEKKLETALLKGDYQPVREIELEKIASALTRRKKDAVLNIRVNSEDLRRIRAKAKKLDIPYQTLISELIHRFAA